MRCSRCSARDPSTGCSSARNLRPAPGEVWPLNVGQVYTTLQRLERDGLVESDGSGDEGPQKAFRITAAGDQELAGWLRTPPDLSSPPRDELVIKVLIAARLPDVDVHEVIQAHRRYLVQLMQQWTRIKEDDDGQDLGLGLAVDAELFRLDSVTRWLDAADGRLRRAAADASPPPARRRHRCRRCGAGRGCRGERPGGPVKGAGDAGGAPHASGRRSMAMLELRGVSKVYGQGATEVQALRGVDLSVASGAMVAVMGPSGSGKSTLLTIAGSLEDPTSGEVLIDGAPLSAMSRNAKARLRRRTVGYLFQDFNLLAGLTAAENVSLPLELDGVPARKARAAGLQVLDDLGLGDRASRFPDELSGGERQRVAIARAIVGDRRLLLADEPSGALDSANGEAVMRLVHSACARGVAAVVVTHDAQLASWADRVVFLRDGRVSDQTAPRPGPESLLVQGPTT